MNFAAALLTLLKAAQTAGTGPVSTSALRKQLGCEKLTFDAVCEHLGSRVTRVARSLQIT